MSSGYQKFIAMGNLTKAPELKTTPNGVSVCSFTIAVNRERSEDKADFIPCVAWRGTAEFVSTYFSKGKPIGVEGTLQSRTYTDKDGNNRTAYEVVCSRCFFVGNGSSNGNAREVADVSETPQAENGFAEVEDDDLPF